MKKQIFSQMKKIDTDIKTLKLKSKIRTSYTNFLLENKKSKSSNPFFSKNVIP